MPYLGTLFDTVKMQMSIPPKKIAEVKEEESLWRNKKSARKKSLQQLLGKLFRVSRCVQFSRGFMDRNRYLRQFNCIEMLYPSDPPHLSLNQLLDTESLVNCSDAELKGGEAYFESQYWSRSFHDWLQDSSMPIHLTELWVVVMSAWLWGNQ